MKRILTTTATPEIDNDDNCTCQYFDQFGNSYLVEYAVINPKAENFKDVCDWDNFTIYGGGYSDVDITGEFEEIFIESESGYNQAFVSKNNLTDKDIDGEIFKEIPLTFTSESTSGDIFEKIVALGYSEINAKSKALNDLKYACCTDFTSPASCKKGTTIEYFKAYGIPFYDNFGYDEDEIAEFCGWEQCLIYEYKCYKFALPDDFSSYKEGGEIESDEIRKFDSWKDVYKSLNI